MTLVSTKINNEQLKSSSGPHAESMFIAVSKNSSSSVDGTVVKTVFFVV